MLTENRKQKPKTLKIGTLLTENKKQMLNNRNVLFLIKDRNEHQTFIPALITDNRMQKPNRLNIGNMLTENKKQILNTRNIWILIKDKKKQQQNIPTRNEEAEAKQVRDWNPAYRKQEADANHQKYLDPHQRQK